MCLTLREVKLFCHRSELLKGYRVQLAETFGSGEILILIRCAFGVFFLGLLFGAFVAIGVRLAFLRYYFTVFLLFSRVCIKEGGFSLILLFDYNFIGHL